MDKKKTAFFVLLTMIIGACATTGPGSGASDAPLYFGYGTGSTVTQALNRAKQDVLIQVIEDLLDDAVRAVKNDQLSALFYETVQPNGYFYVDTLRIVSEGKDGSTFVYRISVRVNLAAVVSTLSGNDIYGGSVLPGATDDVVLSDRESPPQTGASVAIAVSVGETATDDAVLLEYLDSLTFLVYFNDIADEDPFLMKAAVAIANRYLAEVGINLVDFETVETIKRDQELAYEAQTGQSIGLIQWIAQKLDADIYVEIDAQTTAETLDGKYYGQANITVEFFSSSTAALLSSVPYRSPRTFSSSSELDALNNAIQSSVYQAMPVALEQVYARMRKMSSGGIPYELIVQETPDARMMRDFMKRLSERVERVEIISQSAEETRYRVYLLGAIADLQDIVFEIADLMLVLKNLKLVYLRGKSITFSSGL